MFEKSVSFSLTCSDLAGRTFGDVNEANERALTWCKDEIGREVHGTTKKQPYLVSKPTRKFFHSLRYRGAPTPLIKKRG